MILQHQYYSHDRYIPFECGRLFFVEKDTMKQFSDAHPFPPSEALPQEVHDLVPKDT